MRDQFDASAEKTADVRLAEFGLRLECPAPEVEYLARIDLAGHQPLLRQADAGDIRDRILADLPPAAGVNDDAVLLGGRLDYEGDAVAHLHGFARLELDALQDRGAEGVKAVLLGGGKLHGDPPRPGIDGYDQPETQFRFPFAHASLADNTRRHDTIRPEAEPNSKGKDRRFWTG